jgi:hypothetical protein
MPEHLARSRTDNWSSNKRASKLIHGKFALERGRWKGANYLLTSPSHFFKGAGAATGPHLMRRPAAWKALWTLIAHATAHRKAWQTKTWASLFPWAVDRQWGYHLPPLG